MKILRKKSGPSPEDSVQVQSTEYEVADTDEVGSSTSEESDEVQSKKYEVRSTEEADTDEVGSNKYKVQSTEYEVTSEDGITESFVKEARAFAEGQGLSPEEFDEAMTQLKQFRSSSTPVTVNMLEMMHKAINYDRDVAQAKEQGEINGRNAKIEECLMQPEQSDGLPHVKGSNINQQKHATSIFDLARSVR